MAEVGISVAAKLSEYLVDPALCEGRYLFCVAKITRNLETKKEELILTQGRVQKDVEEALKRTEEIDDAVKRWKNKVKEIIAEVENLQQELKANNGCFRGWCPTWKRYRLCKQLAKKTEIMLQLSINSKFEPFSHPVPLPDIEYFSSGNFMYFKSTEVAEGKLLEAFQGESCYMIGLYGMGGSGKTSLAKEVGKKAKEEMIFDRVLITTVSQNPDVRKIQGELADILGLKFEEDSEHGRAGRLSMRLKSGERILIILDDVWAKLDFEKIGIPAEGDNKGCKVLLTTREQQVCRLMNCKTRIPLALLSEDESWSLFKKYASRNDASFSNSMNQVARGIVTECKGLPIAIVAVGTSLKEKLDDAEWDIALDNLMHSKPLDVDPGVRDAFTCLKLSYDYLKNETAKSILLMCSMFPEDHEIEIEDLIRYGIGLGLCEQRDSFEIARKKVKVAIRNLIESCLLTYSENNKDRLKMHDMVRDAALWIASTEKGTVMVNQGKKLDELVEDKVVQDYYAISSWDMIIDRFPCELNAPKLEILLLKSRSKLDLSDASFEGVKELKVMAVTNDMHGRLALSVPLAQTTQWLTNLRTLRLVRLNLKDISFVVSLRRLEILDLQYSEFKELPNGIKKLNKLKLLDLSECRIEVCWDDVIRRCSQLEELYVHGYSSIESYKFFDEKVNFIKLWRYIISVGYFPSSVVCSEDFPERVLCLEEFNISTSSKVMKDLLQRAAMVCLRGLKGGCKSIIPEMVQAVGGMKQLTKLDLEMCDEIECLINATHARADSFQVDDVFPMLVNLSLECMLNLKYVCRGPTLLSFFQKLESLYIGNCENLHSMFPGGNLCNLKSLTIVECPKLTSLFPVSVAQTLLKLEKISLGECEFLEHMIRNGEGGTNTGQEILPVPDCSSSLNRIQNLFPILKKLRLVNLPYFLKVFQENYYPSRPSTKKQELELETDVENARSLSDNAPALFGPLQLSILGLQHLQSLRVGNCGKVKYLFSMDVLHKSLPCLNSIYIEDCEELEEIIYENEESQHISNAEGCFQNLKQLRLVGCNKLKRLFSSTIATMLPQLESLAIGDAPQLVEVFRHKTEDNIEKIELPNLRKIHLLYLPVLVDVCQGMKLHAVKLDDIKIGECPKFAPVSESFQMALEAYDEQVSNQVLDFQKPDMFVISTARRLSLIYLTDLMFLWKGPTLISFKSLEVLRVNGCIKLKSIFSAAVIMCLPQLESLRVLDCEELEEIISDEEDKERQFLNPSNSHPQHVLCFPKLDYLKIKGCGKLKCVFPVSMAGDLPKLYEMYIEGCSKLEHVFGSVHKAHDTEVTELVLPKLTSLELRRLPSLIDIGAGFQSQFRFQALDTCEVEDCPNFPKPEPVMVPSA